MTSHVKRMRLFVTAALALAILWANPGSALALAGGSLGSWQLDNDFTMNVTGGATSVTYNGYVYQIGGYNGSSSLTTVLYAQTNPDGSLGNWTATTSLPIAKKFATSIVYNGYVFVMGGSPDNTVFSNAVYSAPINPNGTLGSWTLIGTTPAVSHKATAVVSGEYVYYMGGYSGIFQDGVYYAHLNNNGTTGSWGSTTSLPVAMSDATSVAYNGYIYELAGFDGSFKATAYYAKTNADGTIGAWATTAALPAGMNLASAALHNGYAYVLGGQNGSGILKTVYSARLRSDGTITAWQTATSLSSETMEGSAVAANGYLYMIGGNDTVVSYPGAYYAAITADTTSQNLTNAVDAAAVAITMPSGTDITCASSQTEASQTQQDGNYSYPLGLIKLCFTTPAVNNQVTLTFVTNLKPAQVVARHYNATTGTYSSLDGASITQTTLGGKAALQLTYTIADNGALDEDSAVGAIADPVGLALSIAPSTGYGTPNTSSLLATTFGAVGSILVAAGFALHRTQKRKA